MGNGAGLQAGKRVFMSGDVDLSPHTVLRAGERGTVRSTETDALGVYAANIRMDKQHEGLRQWANCAYLVSPEIDVVEVLSRAPLVKRLAALGAGVGGGAVIMWPKVSLACAFLFHWAALGTLMGL